jgi:hypothetical protein
MVLHNIDTIRYTLLCYEKIYKGVDNKQYIVVCGIFQYSNLFAVDYLISISCFSYTLIWKAFDGICIDKLYTTLVLPEVMLSCLLLYCVFFFLIFRFFTIHIHSTLGVRTCVWKGRRGDDRGWRERNEMKKRWRWNHFYHWAQSGTCAEITLKS